MSFIYNLASRCAFIGSTACGPSAVRACRFSSLGFCRLVAPPQVAAVKRTVREILAAEPALRLLTGKKVLELLPDIEWDKDKAKYWNEKLTDMEPVGDEVTVCNNWYEIEDAIFKDKSFPPSRVRTRIKEMVRKSR